MIIKDNVTPNETAILNAFLATKTASDIEPDQRQRCLEYLNSALLMHSVKPCIDSSTLPGLERLATELSSFQ